MLQERERMLSLRATMIQKVVRGWMCQVHFLRMRSAAIILQKLWRGFIERKRYKKVVIYA